MLSRLTQFTKSAQISMVCKQINQYGNIYGNIKMAPPDPILGTTLAYKADKDPRKINLGVGAYRDDNEKSKVFDIVKKIEDQLIAKNLDKEYIPIDGIADFKNAARDLMFGKNSAVVKENRIASTQTLSGTGALRIGFEFISNHVPGDAYVSNPSWGNHHPIIRRCGLNLLEYTYYDPKTRGFNFKGMIQDLKKAKKGSWLLLHPCAHNPTGVDPTFEQWQEIAEVMRQGELNPFFDSAYQGFATGDLIDDSRAIRYFADQGFQMIVSQSFAKNMGLYGERVGALHIVCSDKNTADIALSQVKLNVRHQYSSPPAHGARIAAAILNSEQNFQAWAGELKAVSHRIIQMRQLLRQRLEELKVPGTWDHITTQIGMFSYTGLTPQQCETLINKHHIYLLKNGRISMCGVTTKNVNYLAESIRDAILTTQ